MIALLRVFAVAIFAIVMFIGGCGYCLLSPRNPKHVFTFGRLFGKMSRVFGIKLELRIPEDAYSRGQHVYIANHQNNWDLFTVSSAVTPKVVTVGKKSLAWMPLFGQLYWLTGNILIDRGNRSKAKGTIDQVVDSIKQSDVSVWMFQKGRAHVAVAYCHLKPAHSMLLSAQRCQSFRSCVVQLITLN